MSAASLNHSLERDYDRSARVEKDLDLGGHMASYQSSASFYEICFNHFFRAPNEQDGGLVYYQGHISLVFMRVLLLKVA